MAEANSPGPLERHKKGDDLQELSREREKTTREKGSSRGGY
jgi:hypothetical protein